MLSEAKTEQPTETEEEALKFLRQTPPFQFLDDGALRRIVAQTETQYFSKGTHVLRQNEPATGYLYIIRWGGVKKLLLTEADGQVLVEVAGEGELFGVLSSVMGDISRMDVITLEDTLCYVIPRVVIQELLEAQPTFAHHLLHFSIRHYLDWSLAELRQSSLFSDTNTRLLFTSQVRDLGHTPIVTCLETVTIQVAAQRMSAEQASAAVIVGKTGQPAGIVTDWDLRERVIAPGCDIHQPVREVMSKPVITISAHEPVYEALRLMMAQHIHHLVIVEDDRPVGLLTEHDLVVLRMTSPLFIVGEIERQTQPAGLGQALSQAHQAMPLLLQQGIRAGQLGWLMADINDRLVARTLELTEAALGPPPVPYCWLVLGSEGRREQTVKTDQDNALIYTDPSPEGATGVRAYFLELGHRTVATLVEAGFPPCQGQYTADNPQWVQSLGGWSDQFRRWVAAWELEEIVDALIFFDLRGVYGDLSLADQLWQVITGLLEKHTRFLSRLAHHSTTLTPPVGLLGHLVVEHSGEHKDEFDLKLRGTVPVVDLARFLALRHGLQETNTLSRLERLKAAGHLPADLADELAQAFEFMLHLRMRQQWEQNQAGRPPSNYLNPQRLSTLERSFLREAFKVIGRAQAFLRTETHVRVGRLY